MRTRSASSAPTGSQASASANHSGASQTSLREDSDDTPASEREPPARRGLRSGSKSPAGQMCHSHSSVPGDGDQPSSALQEPGLTPDRVHLRRQGKDLQVWKITHSQDAEVESSLELGHSPTESDDELSENTQHMRMLVTRAHRRRSGRAEVISSPAQDLDAWERDRRIQLCGGLDPLQDIQGVGALHQFTGDPAVEETDQTSQLDDLINKMVTDASPIRALPVSNWWSHATLSSGSMGALSWPKTSNA